MLCTKLTCSYFIYIHIFFIFSISNTIYLLLCEGNNTHILREMSLFDLKYQWWRENLSFLENCVVIVCERFVCWSVRRKKWRVNDFVCSFSYYMCVLKCYSTTDMIIVLDKIMLGSGKKRFEWPKSMYIMVLFFLIWRRQNIVSVMIWRCASIFKHF